MSFQQQVIDTLDILRRNQARLRRKIRELDNQIKRLELELKIQKIHQKYEE